MTGAQNGLDPTPAVEGNRTQALDGARPSECGSHYAPRWYVVQTRRGTIEAMQAVQSELLAQGFQSFLPKIRRPIRAPQPGAPRRHRKAVQPHPLMPAYPRYLFVLFDADRDQWRPICHTRGVVQMFGTSPERPTPMPHDAMARLLIRASKWAEFADEQDKAATAPLEPGTIARLIAGPMQGMQGIVVACTGKRTRLHLLAWDREVEADRASVAVEGAERQVDERDVA